MVDDPTAAGSRPPLPQRLADGPPLLGTLTIVPSPEMTEVLALAGFEVVVADTEHGSFGTEALPPLILAARTRGAYAMVRVRTAEASLISSALDAGADGVIVPQISSVDAARAAVAAARFSPRGTRGANPFVRAAGYRGNEDWYAHANETTAVVVMIEGPAGIETLPEILRVDHLTGVLVGPFDLSHALGIPGRTEDPAVIAAVERVIEQAGRAGVSSGVFAPTPAAARRWMKAGASFVIFGVDTALTLEGVGRLVGEALP